jgi:hypothetical protein
MTSPFSTNSFGSLFSPSSSLGAGTNLLSNFGVAPSIVGAATDLGLAGLGHNNPPNTSAALPYNWFYVTPRFNAFLANLTVTAVQQSDAMSGRDGVVACLNRHYRDNNNSKTENSILMGSWGKQTHNRPPRDIDVLYLLPPEVYYQYEGRTGNKQSQLLQEVRDVLRNTFWQTEIKADRHVVSVPFGKGEVELAVGFRYDDQSIRVCDTKDGGSWIISTAEAEAYSLSVSDLASNGNTRALIRMLKCWQDHHKVPLKSFVIERLVIEFMLCWSHRDRGVFWYDWMVRDFFAFLLSKQGHVIYMPGNNEAVHLGYDWVHKAKRAHANAVEAEGNERGNYQYLAGDAWQKIFGTTIPQASV